MINIPKQLWYVINPKRGDLAYMTYYEQNAAFEKRKATGISWAKGYGANPDKDGVITDNVPTSGIYIGSSVSRWSTSNKLFRVNDPRGFTVEVPTDNIATLLHLTTVSKGIIQEECVWARDGGNHILLPVNSEPYLKTLDQMDTIANKLISVKDLKPGDVVQLFEGNEYTFMGRGKVTWKMKPYRWDSWSSYNRKRIPLPEYDYTGSGYVNIFKYTYSSGNVSYETKSDPKIVKIIRNEEINRQIVTRIYPSGKHENYFDYEVIGVKWKD
jgi:hypothetical protein